ncbi:MAG TPA: toxic anion resistance protein [Candidatus Limnocylindrales bacterium]|jgi:uncharacterized protein YaaN involved in tellurite resistance
MTEPSLDLSSTAPVAAPAPAATEPAPAPAAEVATGTLTLEPPAAVAAVPESRAEDAVKLDPAQAAKLDDMVSSYLEAVTSLDTHDPKFTSRVNDIAKLGDDDIRSSANVSNRLLEKPMSAMTQGGISQAGNVSKSLMALRKQVEDLDPQKQGGNLLSPRRLLGVFPMGDRLVDYFRKYQSSQSHINAIIVSLYDGQDELRRDNADIEQEKANLWSVMGRLRQYAYLAAQLDAGLTAKIAQIEATDPDRAKILKDDLLFPVRQKRQDLLTQLAVSVQGYLALDLIRRNNVELIKGVDRATTTTISALRTAVIVAQALSDQKLVLDQITALNETTGALIESTSDMLHQQSAQISEQAASATVDLAKLQKAFQNIYLTMDEIDTFKVKALDNMQTTISALQTELDKSQSYVNRTRAMQAAEPQDDSTGSRTTS